MSTPPRFGQFDTASIAELIRNRSGLHGRHHDIIRNDMLSGIERLAAWIWHQNRIAEWDEHVNFNASWPVTLPMLTCAMLNTLHDDVVRMVGDRVTHLQACTGVERRRRIDRMALIAENRATLLQIVIDDARISKRSRLDKEQLVKAILDARHPMPALHNEGIAQLWQDELADAHERVVAGSGQEEKVAGATGPITGFDGVQRVPCPRCESAAGVTCFSVGVDSYCRGAPLKRAHSERYAAAKSSQSCPNPATTHERVRVHRAMALLDVGATITWTGSS